MGDIGLSPNVQISVEKVTQWHKTGLLRHLKSGRKQECRMQATGVHFHSFTAVLLPQCNNWVAPMASDVKR